MAVRKKFLKDLIKNRIDVEKAEKEIDAIEADIDKGMRSSCLPGERLKLNVPFMPKYYEDELKRRYKEMGWKVSFFGTLHLGVRQIILT